MFSVDNYYEMAHSGDKINNREVIEFINEFNHVVIWGGSYLGRAIGKYLLRKGINIESYWDIRSQELKEVNGIPVVQPFSSSDKTNTLIVLCIANNVIITNLLRRLQIEGYGNILRGDFLYEGTICPFTKETGINAQQCSGTMECRQVYCHRLGNIVKGKSPTSVDMLHFTSVTLIINSKCSLRCKFCTSYMNEYPPNKKVNIPFDRISKDIDHFFDVVDSVGTITVMGGEPFMHPDIARIIKKLCEKMNFGLISLATSGTFPIRQEQLEGFFDKRVNISFSNYTKSINERQKAIYHNNIELVRRSGVCYSVGLFSPEWIIPPTLYRKECSEEDMAMVRSKCINWYQIKNGKLHPCDFATAIYSLDINNYECDYVDLTTEESKEKRRRQIRNFISQPYYQSCAHHIRSSKDRIGAGYTKKSSEQGYLDFKKPLDRL